MLGKFGKITESKLKCSKVAEQGKNKGKVIMGSGVITFAKPGTVQVLSKKAELEFKGKKIKLKQKGVSRQNKSNPSSERFHDCF